MIVNNLHADILKGFSWRIGIYTSWLKEHLTTYMGIIPDTITKVYTLYQRPNKDIRNTLLVSLELIIPKDLDYIPVSILVIDSVVLIG